MTTDILKSALINSMARNLSVTDLIRTAETLKQSDQVGSVETLYATWIQHNGDHPLLSAVLFNYSVIMSDAGKLEQARGLLERAIALNPELMPAYINLGRTYERLGNAGLAVVQWSAALAKMAGINGPNITYKTTALNQSARALETANEDETAESMLRQSLEIDCRQREAIQHLIALRQRQCKWPVILPSDRVDPGTLMQGISPLSAAVLTDDPLLQLAVACHYNKQDVGPQPGALDAWPIADKVSGPIRVGYLSSDLREHAVGYLMTEVFGFHDRGKVEVLAYYCGPPANDALHERFKSTADHWSSISHMDDASAARMMVEHGVQILVDLNGYTREARLKLVALRPAPIIVNWLGFPGTMGSPTHHYIIADDAIIPQSHELFYSEKVLRLPCYQPSSRQRTLSSQPICRKDFGLPDDAMVYCCFNGAHKINRFTFDRWLMILARVPQSVLWLLGSTEGANERLRDYAAERGIDRQRLIFADKLINPLHLARYPLADLFLDTTPYGAHTTASDALWMGVPVLTLSGRSFASRVCASLVRAAGIADLVCTCAEQYVDQAVAFGRNPSLLSAYREKLRLAKDSSTLFDMPLLVRHLEGLYRQMWVEYQAGARPQPNLSNLEVCLEVGIQVGHDDIEVQTIEDYAGWWLDRLAQRHKFRPIEPDRRLSALGQFPRPVPLAVRVPSRQKSNLEDNSDAIN
jgi:predicted O-linked N-acetylglucosamine transferase (SPINDLY family)